MVSFLSRKVISGNSVSACGFIVLINAFYFVTLLHAISSKGAMLNNWSLVFPITREDDITETRGLRVGLEL